MILDVTERAGLTIRAVRYTGEDSIPSIRELAEQTGVTAEWINGVCVISRYEVGRPMHLGEWFLASSAGFASIISDEVMEMGYEFR